MARPSSDDGPTKFQRYRLARRSEGLRLVRVWVPDPRTPEFQAELARQVSLLSGAPEEAASLKFIEAAMDWPEP